MVQNNSNWEQRVIKEELAVGCHDTVTGDDGRQLVLPGGVPGNSPPKRKVQTPSMVETDVLSDISCAHPARSPAFHVCALLRCATSPRAAQCSTMSVAQQKIDMLQRKIQQQQCVARPSRACVRRLLCMVFAIGPDGHAGSCPLSSAGASARS